MDEEPKFVHQCSDMLSLPCLEKYLAESGDDEKRREIVNSLDPHGETPLCKVAARKYEEGPLTDEVNAFVNILLKYGANATKRNALGFTPIHIAARAGNHTLLEIMLKHDPTPVNIKSFHGETPLHEALKSGCVCCVEVLLAYNADCKLQDLAKNNAFHVAAYAAIPYPEKSLAAIKKMLEKNESNIDQLQVPNSRLCKPRDILKRVFPYGVYYHLKKILGATAEELKQPVHCDFDEESENLLKEAKAGGLLDAHKAGTYEWTKCTLILTEGSSAKAFSRVGISSIEGDDYYGVYSLGGKLNNARGLHFPYPKKILYIASALGLKPAAQYNPLVSLRYSHVLIATDQDSDGCHIKGLIINMFHFYWPELLKNPLILCDLTT